MTFISVQTKNKIIFPERAFEIMGLIVDNRHKEIHPEEYNELCRVKEAQALPGIFQAAQWLAIK